MTDRYWLSFLLPAVLALGSVAPVCAQGQPDLEGVWDAASMTPLERPVALGNQEFYTPEEMAAYEKQRAHELNRDRRDGSADADLGRAYNDGWFDRGAHLASDRRTSRLIDPPNGRFPAMTPEAAKKYHEMHAWLVQHADDGPETRMLPDRSFPGITTTIIRSCRLPAWWRFFQKWATKPVRFRWPTQRKTGRACRRA